MLVMMQVLRKIEKALLHSYMQLRQLSMSPETPAGGDFSVEVVHIQAAAVQDGIREVVGRHIPDAPAAVEGAQVLKEVLLQQAEPVQTCCAHSHCPCHGLKCTQVLQKAFLHPDSMFARPEHWSRKHRVDLSRHVRSSLTGRRVWAIVYRHAARRELRCHAREALGADAHVLNRECLPLSRRACEAAWSSRSRSCDPLSFSAPV